MLVGVGLTMVGCASSRDPILVIAPSYSYVQDDLARANERVAPVDSSAASIAKLPPLPSAPLFDPLVRSGIDQPFK